MNTANPLVLSYVAGLFDGEGSIVIGASKRQRSYGVALNHWLQVGIGITDEPTVVWLRDTFGGHVTRNGKRREQGARRACWSWRVMSNEAASFLKAVLPYLRVKREQAELAIAFQETAACYSGRRVSDETLARREAFRTKLRAMTMGPLSGSAWR
jgi:hypothetical protein